MTGGMRLFRFSGIDVHLDWSLAIVFLLITFSLGLHLFPIWQPDWSAPFSLFMGGAAAVLFLFSVLVHEFSHALVGRRYGMTVRRITLFVFGGMAHLESEPPHWRAEFWMSIVGPITSLIIGVVCLTFAGMWTPPQAATMDPRQAMALMNPVATLLFWVGAVNVLLAVFNMVPGFPLDGGRVLRALLWGISGDFTRATRWATLGGQALAGLLIAAGVAMMLGIHVPPFGSGLIPGLWLAFIGWFLNNAAVAGYRQTRMRQVLGSVPVARLYRQQITRVPATSTLRELVNMHVLAPGDQRAWPVERNERLVGLITLKDIRSVATDRLNTTKVEQVMTPWDNVRTVSPDDSAASAMDQLVSGGFNQLPVMDRGELAGLLRREDLMRWIAWAGGEPEDHR